MPVSNNIPTEELCRPRTTAVVTNESMILYFNTLQAYVPISYSLKTPENLFRCYKMEILTRNEFIS